MREHRFKVWDRELNRFDSSADVYVDPDGGIFELTGFAGEVSLEPTNRYAVVWWTGLHDKNGKEIYEGDIVHGGSDYGRIIGEVNWEGSFAGWAIGNTRMSAFRLSACKIIGNIWENPELLEPK